jgi:hypothetical protein
VLKEWCDRELNLDIHLNARAHGVAVADERIVFIDALQTSKEKAVRYHAEYFIERSGDGDIGAKAGDIWRLGQENRHEFGESIEPEGAKSIVLPCAIMVTTRDVGYPEYAMVSIEDMLNHYLDADGLILDWVEFGAYKLEDKFTCFCSHCQRVAGDLGLDWKQILGDMKALWHLLHNLTFSGLELAHRLLENPSELLELLVHHPGWLPFLQFKAQSVVSFYERVRQLLEDLGMKKATLRARGWHPPWNRSSGSDYRALADICGAVSPKLFTFDHAVLPRWYDQTLQTWNPEPPEALILDTLIAWMNLPDDFEKRAFDLFPIPAAEEQHPARLESHGHRLEEVGSHMGGRASFYPISHPYIRTINGKTWSP